MNKNILKKAILIATSLWACQSMAVGFTVPNTFESGTAASAAEVNANFEAIETGIDNNSNSINTNVTDINTNTANIAALSGGGSSAVQLKDANGVYVGRVIGIGNLNHVSLLTDQGYRTTFNALTGTVNWGSIFYFSSADCTGAVYFEGENTVGTVVLPYTHFNNATASASGWLVYVPYDTLTQSVSISSQITYSGACEVITPVQKQVYTALQNDPNVTGIQNTVSPAHMRLE